MRERYDTILLGEPTPGVLQVTLNRPAAANAMNTQMGLDLLEVFGALFADPIIAGRLSSPALESAPSALAAISRSATA